MSQLCCLCGKPAGKEVARAEVSHMACAMESACKAHGRPLPSSGYYGQVYAESCVSRAKAVAEENHAH